MNNVCEIFQRLIDCRGKEDIMLCPEQKEPTTEVVSPSMTNNLL